MEPRYKGHGSNVHALGVGAESQQGANAVQVSQCFLHIPVGVRCCQGGLGQSVSVRVN